MPRSQLSNLNFRTWISAPKAMTPVYFPSSLPFTFVFWLLFSYFFSISWGLKKVRFLSSVTGRWLLTYVTFFPPEVSSPAGHKICNSSCGLTFICWVDLILFSLALSWGWLACRANDFLHLCLWCSVCLLHSSNKMSLSDVNCYYWNAYMRTGHHT